MLFVSLITANYHQRLTIQLLSVWHKNISVFSETLLVIMNHRTCVFVNSSVCVCVLAASPRYVQFNFIVLCSKNEVMPWNRWKFFWFRKSEDHSEHLFKNKCKST